MGRCVAEHAPGVRTVPRDRRVPQANRGACGALRATASLASPAMRCNRYDSQICDVRTAERIGEGDEQMTVGRRACLRIAHRRGREFPRFTDTCGAFARIDPSLALPVQKILRIGKTPSR